MTESPLFAVANLKIELWEEDEPCAYDSEYTSTDDKYLSLMSIAYNYSLLFWAGEVSWYGNDYFSGADDIPPMGYIRPPEINFNAVPSSIHLCLAAYTPNKALRVHSIQDYP